MQSDQTWIYTVQNFITFKGGYLDFSHLTQFENIYYSKQVKGQTTFQRHF